MNLSQIATEEVNENHVAEDETTKDEIELKKDQVVAEATVEEIISTTL